jgi:hypothetical protein
MDTCVIETAETERIMESCPEDMELEIGDEIQSGERSFLDTGKIISPPQTLPELIAELHRVFSGDKINIDYVQTLMTLYKSNRKDWKKYAKYDPHR